MTPQWILLITLYTSSGTPLETLKFDGYPDQATCNHDGWAIGFTMEGFRPEVAKTRSACIQVPTPMPKDQG
jgi:hypothetical protein